jgi:hypothetical protein
MAKAIQHKYGETTKQFSVRYSKAQENAILGRIHDFAKCNEQLSLNKEQG